ncbi:uncharacterized protein LOC115678492 [Syzygium oleosum]|uniref:uncharacterized protein LOC115678492 n=1 Tax=Syzygium oleosum TaxID=219896 RepID=UPI0011D1E046|nr:uncharacterized protein LOC115678492 [Syzygium oleosum]
MSSSKRWKSIDLCTNQSQRHRPKCGFNMLVPFNVLLTAGSKLSVWRIWWRKIKKEQRRIFHFSAPACAPYDPFTYAQNFDQGQTWADPDNLSRTFSARFAVPSRILEETDLMG